MTTILLIDNYDSFTYNLVQYLSEVMRSDYQIEVYRNDVITIQEISQISPSYIVISPGPCTPNEAGISMELCRKFGGVIPILGVCLGHQVIAQAFGGKIIRAPKVVHGKTDVIHHDQKGIFHNLEQDFVATRYHSLMVEVETLPDDLEISAVNSSDIIMAIRHKSRNNLIGVQFHPESILTSVGRMLLRNFLSF